MIPLVAPCITAEDYSQFSEAIDTGTLLVDDDTIVRCFEEEFADYVGCVGGVAVNSGTNALWVALAALETGLRTVGMPSYTCRALLDAVQYVADEVRLGDNECVVPLAYFGSRLTGADVEVIPHMFGTKNPNAEFVNGAGSQVVVEDLTLSLGAVQSPHIGVCSFHRDKMITTGRGGIIVGQDQAFLDRCRELAYYDQPRNGRYSPAFSFGMTAMQAALGRSQLRQLPGFIERRREIASHYTTVFREVGIETPDSDVDSVFFRYIIGVSDPARMVVELAERDIEAGRGVNPLLHRLLGLPNEQFPGAEECFSKLLSVPVHPGLTDEQVDYITGQVIQVCAP